MAGDRVVPTGPGLGAEVSEDTARSPGWIGDVRQSPGLQKLAAGSLCPKIRMISIWCCASAVPVSNSGLRCNSAYSGILGSGLNNRAENSHQPTRRRVTSTCLLYWLGDFMRRPWELAERTGLLTYFSALEDPQQSGKVVILQLK
jgi:hypothetical protein